MTQSVPPDEQTVPANHAPAAADKLKQAMRRARADEAERAGAGAELRAARLGRLELLQDALQPLAAEIPADVDLFDIALVPSSNPRLFIDMIGFVEMARDTRAYVLQQDTRHGRIKVAETEHLDSMVEAVTDYVARRLLERDKALASDARARTHAERGGRETDASRPFGRDWAVPREPPAGSRPAAAPGVRRSFWFLRWAAIAFGFLIDLLGAIAFFTILGAIGWYVWSRMHAPM